VTLPVDPASTISLIDKIWEFASQLFGRKRGARGGLVVQATTNVGIGRHWTWWSSASRGSEPGMQIVGDFYISNTTNESTAITSVELIQWCQTFGVVPRRRRLLGDIMVRAQGSDVHGHYPILAKSVTSGRAIWFAFPPLAQPGQEFTARVCLIDSAGRRHWTPKLRWYDITVGGPR